MVCQENHYYPFGLNMAGIEYYGEPGTPYQYNGKEKEEIFDLGWYDFGARWYSPQIGRWFNTDPAEQVASPYDFCGGDPIANVDPDGRSFARWFAQNEQVMVTGSLAMVGFALSTASFGTATPAVVAVAAAVVATTASAGFATYYAGGTPGQIFASVAISLTISGLTACAGTGVANAGFTNTPAGAIVTGALLGGGAASLSTGLNNLVMGRSFESGMLANALIGAWGGAIAAAGAKSKLESANSKAANLATKKAEAPDPLALTGGDDMITYSKDGKNYISWTDRFGERQVKEIIGITTQEVSAVHKVQAQGSSGELAPKWRG